MAPTLTQSGHYRFGFDGGLFNGPAPRADGAEATFDVQFGRATRDVEPWRDECVRAAAAIGERARGAKVVLACSNGWDSEIMFRAFRLAGVPFEVAVVEMRDGLNWHDVSYILALCEREGVEVVRHELDLLPFIRDELPRYCDEHALTMPAMAMQLWLLDRIDGLPVFGGGDLHLRRRPYKEAISVEFAPHRTVLGRALVRQGREGYPFFFLYSPEMMAAYLEHPLTRVFMRTSFSMRIGEFRRFRHPTYAFSFPELGPQRMNANGWELVRPLYFQIKRRLDERFARLNPLRELGYFELLQMLARDPEQPRPDAPHAIEPSQLDPAIWFHADGA